MAAIKIGADTWQAIGQVNYPDQGAWTVTSTIGKTSNLPVQTIITDSTGKVVISGGGNSVLTWIANAGIRQDWPESFDDNLTRLLLSQIGELLGVQDQLNPNVNQNNNVDGATPVVNDTTNPASQNSQFINQGGDDDDKTEGTDTPPQQISGTTAGTTNKPGKRLKNPLGNFASYTYNISLYMITPDAYDAFIASGRRNVNALRDAGGGAAGATPGVGGGAYLICQSGGINNATSQRAEGFDFDYYIDSLRIISNTNGKETQTSTNTSNIQFKIIEPYGFSFISNLKRAADKLQKQSKTLNYDKLKNPTKQFFVIGIRFYGYDSNGNIVTPNQEFEDGKLDPSNSLEGVFERFYDILITKINFKIEGKATVYSVEAAPIPPNTAFNIKRGRIDTITKITANTVEEALSEQFENSLLGKLNLEQVKAKEAGKIEVPNFYQIRWLGPENFAQLRTSTIVLKSDTDKSKMPTAPVKNSETATESTAAKSNPNTTKREVTFDGDTAIMAAIEQVIKQSSFLTDALKVIQKSTEQPDTKKKTEEVEENPNPDVLKWYNLSAEVSNAKWDSKVGDFAYTITYVIQPYETPVVTAAYTNDKGQRYYGPHKRYDYWYTGKNSEVLAYEQTLNNTYFNVALDPGDGGDAAKGGTNNIALVPKSKANVSQLGKLGAGNQALNAVVTSLFDPGAYAQAKIKILGDPDFLMQESPGSVNQVYNQFYGTDGFTVNPNGGQVFIEINFKEAVDYDFEAVDGILTINESIQFWKYPKKIQDDIDSRGGGVSYMVIKVTSNFDNGKFVQDVDAVINTFPDNTAAASETDSVAARENANEISRLSNRSNASSGPSPGATDSTTTNTGLTPDTPVSPSPNVTGQTPSPSDQSPNQPTVPTNTGPVSDDDGG